MPFLIHFGGISYLEYYSLLFLEGTLRIMTDFCANLKSIMTMYEGSTFYKNLHSCKNIYNMASKIDSFSLE